MIVPPRPLGTNATIGILGGGQLGRMLALAAARLGFKCHVLCPDPQSCAFDVVRRVTKVFSESRSWVVARIAGSGSTGRRADRKVAVSAGTFSNS